MKSVPECKIVRVRNTLGERLSVPGGVSSDKAVAEAGKRVETLRDDCEAAIPEELAKLEKIVAGTGSRISARQLALLLDGAGRLLTISGTFGFPVLDAVLKRLCDLAVGMLEKNIASVAPVQVHLRAMRLVWKANLSEGEAASILGELSKIHDFYGIKPHKPCEPEQPISG